MSEPAEEVTEPAEDAAPVFPDGAMPSELLKFQFWTPCEKHQIVSEHCIKRLLKDPKKMMEQLWLVYRDQHGEESSVCWYALVEDYGINVLQACMQSTNPKQLSHKRDRMGYEALTKILENETVAQDFVNRKYRGEPVRLNL